MRSTRGSIRLSTIEREAEVVNEEAALIRKMDRELSALEALEAACNKHEWHWAEDDTLSKVGRRGRLQVSQDGRNVLPVQAEA